MEKFVWFKKMKWFFLIFSVVTFLVFPEVGGGTEYTRYLLHGLSLVFFNCVFDFATYLSIFDHSYQNGLIIGALIPVFAFQLSAFMYYWFGAIVGHFIGYRKEKKMGVALFEPYERNVFLIKYWWLFFVVFVFEVLFIISRFFILGFNIQ